MINTITSYRPKKNAWIVFTEGLLIFFKWVLILLNLSNSALALNVWLVFKGWAESETIGLWDNAEVVEVRRNSKETKTCNICGMFSWEVDNVRELFCVHWCCLLVWSAAKYCSFLCLLQETEYSFMSILIRETTNKWVRENNGLNLWFH